MHEVCTCIYMLCLVHYPRSHFIYAHNAYDCFFNCLYYDVTCAWCMVYVCEKHPKPCMLHECTCMHTKTKYVMYMYFNPNVWEDQRKTELRYNTMRVGESLWQPEAEAEPKLRLLTTHGLHSRGMKHSREPIHKTAMISLLHSDFKFTMFI